MTTDAQNSSHSNDRLLTFRGGGWVLLLASIPFAAVLIWAGLGVVLHDADAGGQLSRTIDSFGFDFGDARIDADRIVIGAEDRNFIHPIDQPRMINADEVDRINREARKKYLVTDDRVIGVVINSEARAYPLRMLDWHEVVNDTMQGTPILVSYNGLSDSAAVFDRRISDTEILDFAASGLLYNSHHLLYADSESESDESLWLPLQARAVTGTASREEETLTLLPCEVVTWADWRSRHPGTLVLAPNPDPSRAKFYDRRTYGHYHSSDVLQFPVEPLPPDRNARPYKTPMIAVLVDETFHAYAISELIERADSDGTVIETIANRTLRFHVNDQPPTAWVEFQSGESVPVMYAFWFAWYAMSDK